MFMAEIKDTLKSSVKTKIGGALIYKPIKKTFKRYMAACAFNPPIMALAIFPQPINPTLYFMLVHPFCFVYLIIQKPCVPVIQNPVGR